MTVFKVIEKENSERTLISYGIDPFALGLVYLTLQ